MRTSTEAPARRLSSVPFVLLAAVVPLGACASAADPKAMVPPEVALTNRHAATTCVDVTGGSETNPLWTSEIASADFGTALTEAITKSGAFQAVVEAAGADCRLEVKLVSVEQPLLGFDLEVKVVTQWRLSALAGDRLLAEESVTTSYTAAWGDAFFGTTRLRLANEGAARANIGEGLRRLSLLPPIAGSAAPASRSTGDLP